MTWGIETFPNKFSNSNTLVTKGLVSQYPYNPDIED